MRWQYGITTVPSRRKDYLIRTIASLKAGGFDRPHLFVDGCPDSASYRKQFDLHVTARSQTIRIVGNWMASLWELYTQDPAANMYAIFQDDIVCYRNLRQYLEQSPWPERGYANLYTFRENEQVANRSAGWHEAAELDSASAQTFHGRVQQTGRSATGLVLPREVVTTLLSSPTMAIKPLDSSFGWKRVDGAIVEAMNRAGWREYVHNPSLVQHTGTVSTIGNHHAFAATFRGEEYDACELLPKR